MIWLLVTILIVSIIYWFAIKPLNYWKQKSVQQGSLAWLVNNNFKTLFRKQSFGDSLRKLYNTFPKARYIGMYQFRTPTLMIKDPELIRQVGVKDFEHFHDHRTFIRIEADPLWSHNLFGLTGQKWRQMRATLSPAFTSSKMRSMLRFMTECGERFVNHFVEKAGDDKVITVEMKDAFTRYTNDVIASTAFGITCDSLKNRNNEFFLMGKDASSSFGSVWLLIKFLLYNITPLFGKILPIKLYSKQVHIFFTKIIKETIAVRETQGIVRPDMIHLLLEARKGRLGHETINADNKDNDFYAVIQESDVGKAKINHQKEITDVDITAQALVFFLAGFETVSTAMCFLTYELAVNPDIQEKLYQEIKNTKEKLTYEILLKMKYLDKVVSETLRKWPPAVATDRQCVIPYTIQPQFPDEQPIHLNTNDVIWFPIYALHRDEKYYPNPEKFDPERFSDENKQNIAPYTYLPFGVGPRGCIGSRFALLETKAAICSLLSKFEITVVDKTPIPMKLDKAQFSLASKTGYWVGLKLRH